MAEAEYVEAQVAFDSDRVEVECDGMTRAGTIAAVLFNEPDTVEVIIKLDQVEQ